MSKGLLDPAIFGMLIPITAIVVFGTLAIVKAVIQHRERMAKIGMGMDPDASPADNPDHARR
jgi:hypothetical protein